MSENFEPDETTNLKNDEGIKVEVSEEPPLSVKIRSVRWSFLFYFQNGRAYYWQNTLMTKNYYFLEEILDSKKFNLLFRPLICLVTFWARLLGSVRRYLCTNVHFNMTYKFYRIRYDIMTNKCCGHRLVFQPWVCGFE